VLGGVNNEKHKNNKMHTKSLMSKVNQAQDQNSGLKQYATIIFI
jgi:hypothetical protein